MNKKHKFTVQKIGTSFFAMHRMTMMPFQTRKNPAKKEKFHHQRWKNSKKMKKRKMLCFRKSIRGKQLYKKKLKMLLQRSLKWKKLKQNKNGKTTVIMVCFSSPSIYSYMKCAEVFHIFVTIFSALVLAPSLSSGIKSFAHRIRISVALQN